MPRHNMIVIGTSAGGLKALGAILGALPIDSVVLGLCKRSNLLWDETGLLLALWHNIKIVALKTP